MLGKKYLFNIISALKKFAWNFNVQITAVFIKQRCPTHSPHMTNGHLNVANGLLSQHIKIGLFGTKWRPN